MIIRMSRRPARRAFTLLEMLIVLALLAMFAAFSWPALRSSLRNSRLRDAAKVVRSELAKTRLRAIETGTPQQFRYQPGTGHFEIAPQVSATESEHKPAIAPVERSARATLSDDWAGDLEALSRSTRQRDLPEGVAFCPLPTDPSSDAPPPAAPIARDSGEMGDDQWSAPIVFQPNGRTSNARIRLFGEGKFRIDVILRGLTGVAIASELGRDEELR